MEEKIKNLMNSMNELEKSCLKSVDVIDAFADMDMEELEIMIKLKKVMNLLEDILIEYGETVDEQNRKLDEILELLKKGDRKKEIENGHIIY